MWMILYFVSKRIKKLQRIYSIVMQKGQVYKRMKIGHNQLDQSIKQYDFLVAFEAVLEKKHWAITDGKANLRHWQFILPRIISTQVQSLDISFNMNYAVLKTITHINFESLRHLNLESNFITNIEALSYLKTERLETVNLDNNCVHSIKPLIKLSGCEELREISLNGNDLPIEEIKSFIGRFKKIARLRLGFIDLEPFAQNMKMRKKLMNALQSQITTNGDNITYIKVEGHKRIQLLITGMFMYTMCGVSLLSRNHQIQQESLDGINHSIEQMQQDGGQQEEEFQEQQAFNRYGRDYDEEDQYW